MGLGNRFDPLFSKPCIQRIFSALQLLRAADPAQLPGGVAQQGNDNVRHGNASGGIYFADDLAAQLRLCHPRGRSRERELVTRRFCGQGWCFAFIREGLQRHPIEHTRFCKPLAGEHWGHHPNAPHVLEPGSPADSHPYPVELDLPPWTVDRDIDLRNWLFGFGAGIRIDSPQALRDEHRQKPETALEAHQAG